MKLMKQLLRNQTNAALVLLLSACPLIAADVNGDRLNIGSGQSLSGSWATIAGGIYNTNAAFGSAIGGGVDNWLTTPAEYSVVSGGYSNTIHSWYSVIAGGARNLMDDETEGSVIAGGWGNKIHHDAYAGSISGGAENTIGTNSPYAWIGGGGFNTFGMNADYGVIGGGNANTIHGATHATIAGGNMCQTHYSQASVIGGGQLNVIYSNSVQSTIAGGAENLIYPDSHGTTIGGGIYNEVRNGVQEGTIAGGLDNNIWTNSSYSTIGGGWGNNILNDSIYSTIPGGAANVVEGDYAFAAGRYADASHDGAFVWSDSTGTTFASTNNNEFAVRSHGGVRFQTGATPTGVKLSPGSGTWASLCDRNTKANFVPVNTRTVLEKVAVLPLNTWSYKDQGEGVRHIGPVAQDFHAAFGVGEDDRTITTVDADGVALAAIQGLHGLLKEKDAALKEQESMVKELSVRVQALEKLLHPVGAR